MMLYIRLAGETKPGPGANSLGDAQSKGMGDMTVDEDAGRGEERVSSDEHATEAERNLGDESIAGGEVVPATEISEGVETPAGTEENKYRKFKKVDGASYEKVNQFLRKHTYITAREWAIARLCSDFQTRSGAEMTFIGSHLPEMVPFMTGTYTPQAVNQARSSFKKKVKKAGATFFYGAMCGFFTADQLDDILFEASEVARFLLEVEGTTLGVDDEIAIEDRITEVMKQVAEASARLKKVRDSGEEGGSDR